MLSKGSPSKLALAAALLLAPGASRGAPAASAAGITAPPAQRNVSGALFLGSFPVESHLSGSLFAASGGPVGVTLQFQPARAGASNELVRRLRIPIASDGTLVLRAAAYPAARDKPTRQHQRPSFLIDYDEPSFKPALDSARASLGPAPSVEALARFVDQYITKKGFGRAFDIASVVATRREGDCTEHAVLLTALARAFGYPARVVQGIVLVEVDGKAHAFGHAWAEFYVKSAWHRADAALPPDRPLVYLPLELIADEGPGFAMSIAQTGAGTIAVQGILLSDRR
jgi:hypothetical protein